MTSGGSSAVPVLPAGENSSLLQSKIMIVDDEPINVKVARKYLSLEGYANFVTTTDSREAVALVNDEAARRAAAGHHDAARQRPGHSGGSCGPTALGCICRS